MTYFVRVFCLVALIATLSACSGVKVSEPYLPNDRWDQREKRQSVLGGEGLTFGDSKAERQDQGGTGIGVNGYLWRATLDTISFMPLASADPFGGVVLTDWHTPSTSPNERFKLNVYILGQALRADGIRVAAFRQVRNNVNEWQAIDMDPKAVTDIENAILTRARQLRTESMTQ